ncbi:hypothetical protein [Algoriphagus winogradskyi]|uniref:Outer membrane protein beta-barrel domain-containing protein n=1 Tax=Algoriphagus winogradskyi TaxID=237017 RepID=A0ABY1NE55_9BACT|nr:hypothetical protein [Algoriphagus winogradskyi]SMP07402.1 hypothetical protein SAMN06265367_101590 [Algoriphagus winogradskyi]
MNYRFSLFFVSVFLIPLLACSQEFKVGFGIVSNEEKFNNSYIQIDALAIYEGNLRNSDARLMPYVQYAHSFGSRFKGTIEAQYYKSYASIFATTPIEGFPIDSKKVISYVSRNLELPIGGSLNLFGFNLLKFNLIAGIVPVFSFSSSPHFDKIPDGIDWTQEVVDALNAVETISKKYHTNYLYGFSLEYWRLGLAFTRNHNFSSISNDYRLYGKSYSFERKTISNRITLYYTLFRNNK